MQLPWGGKLPLSPFFGVMGVAPPPNWGRITSVIPRAMGGNMDNKELVAGTTVFFPVFNEGALFSAGDGHAVQGDGEVCITAVETSLSGRFRLSVRKDMHLTGPRAETPTHYITMGFDEDLDDAVKQALARHDPLDRRITRTVVKRRLHPLQSRRRPARDADRQYGQGRTLHAGEEHS